MRAFLVHPEKIIYDAVLIGAVVFQLFWRTFLILTVK